VTGRCSVVRLSFVFALAAALSLPASAADMLSPSVNYNPSIPTIKAVLGYTAGEAFTPYTDLVRYYERLAASAPDRVRMEKYGRSVEGRDLYLVIITSPANLSRLDALRAAWDKLNDPRVTTPAEAQQIAARTPTLVWLSYNIHGNEASSSEAAMQVAYELAASQEANVASWLENCVIIIDPLMNPDGRERYVNFYRQTMGAKPRSDRFAAEHQERWPGGRFNHYLFDLNRDWAWQSQPESVARVAAFRRWSPQVHVDFHEMGAGSTYYFAPPAKPVLPELAAQLGKWYDIYGRANAAAFDKFGQRYFTKESFDLLYPSYGDSWPSLNGAVGMTYEQAGGGAGGLVVELPEQERRLTLRDRAANHFVSSLATIETSAKNREARLRDYFEFRRAAITAGEKGPVRTFYLVPGKDGERISRLVELLLRQGIEVKRAEREIEAEDLSSHWGEAAKTRRLPAGTYVVDLAQPAGFLARTLLEREVKADTVFFYDVSAWSAPLAADVEAYSSPKPAAPGLAAVKQAPVAQGRVEGNGEAVFIIATEQFAGLRVHSRLLEENFKAYVSLRPIKLNGWQFSGGSVIVVREGNPPSLKQRIAELAKEYGAVVYASNTLLSEEGIDLGSERVRFLRKPRIAVVMDSPVVAPTYGAIWHLLEQRMDIPFTPVRAEELRNIDLRAYNVLVLPPDSGEGRGYNRLIDKALASRISDWVKEGGLLVAMRGGAVWATKKKSGLTSVTYRFLRPEDEQARLEEERASEKEKKSDESGSKQEKGASADPSATEKKPAGSTDSAKEVDGRLIKYADREEQKRREEIPGTMLAAVLDNTHPLGFGMGERLAVLNDTAPILELTAKGENPVYFPKTGVKLSGFVTPENEKKLAHTAYVIRERVGRGNVVLFADSPVFRGFSDATSRLLLNAILFGHVHDPNLQ